MAMYVTIMVKTPLSQSDMKTRGCTHAMCVLNQLDILNQLDMIDYTCHAMVYAICR